MTGNDPKNKQREVLTKHAFRDDGARVFEVGVAAARLVNP
jgi:hypothetical protein